MPCISNVTIASRTLAASSGFKLYEYPIAALGNGSDLKIVRYSDFLIFPCASSRQQIGRNCGRVVLMVHHTLDRNAMVAGRSEIIIALRIDSLVAVQQHHWSFVAAVRIWFD